MLQNTVILNSVNFTCLNLWLLFSFKHKWRDCREYNGSTLYKKKPPKSCPAKDFILPLEILLNLTNTSYSFIYIESKRTGRHRICFKKLCFTVSFFFKEEKISQQLLIKICMARYRRGLVLWDLIPTEQTCKVEQEHWWLLCFVNNSQ